MDEKALKQLLGSVKSGRVSVDDAVGKLKDLPFAELGYATLDTHRNLRFGFPEDAIEPAEPVGFRSQLGARLLQHERRAMRWSDQQDDIRHAARQQRDIGRLAAGEAVRAGQVIVGGLSGEFPHDRTMQSVCAGCNSQRDSSQNW